MKKFYNFMVEKRNYLLILMLILAVISAILLPRVGINHDMTKYLPDDSPMKEGIDIMDAEFPGVRDMGGIQVMFKDLDSEEIPSIRAKLESFENVSSVSYDSSDRYNKDNYTLFVVNTDFKYDSPEEKTLEKNIKDEFKSYNMVYQHTLATALTIPFWVYIIVGVVLIVILFVMCSSFFEPFLFLFTIGVAIVINLGTNLMFGYVSDSTFSLSSILQMALSMDYSIILMNRYRQQRSSGLDKKESMKIAYKDAFPSIVSSGMTTVLGLIVLVLMRFKIGMDLGLVMAKGVAISMLCVLTMLPALIVLFDKTIEKTKKKELPIKTKPIAKFTFKARNVLAVCFSVVFVAVICMQGLSTTSFAQPRDNKIAGVFKPDNQIIVMYDNKDEEKIKDIIPTLDDNENIHSVLSFSSTIGKPLSSNEMATAISAFAPMELDKSFIDLLYYEKLCEDKNQNVTLSLNEFVTVVENPALAPFVGEEIQTKISGIKPLLNKTLWITPVPAPFVANALQLPVEQVNSIYQLYFAEKGLPPQTNVISPFDLLQFINGKISSGTEPFNSMLTDEQKAQVTMLANVSPIIVNETKLSATELHSLLVNLAPEITVNQVNMLYVFSDSIAKNNPEWKMSIEDMINYLTSDEFKTQSMLKDFIPAEIMAKLNNAKTMLVGIKGKLVGENHSLILLVTDLPEESKETTDLIHSINKTFTENTDNKFYVIGNSPMNVEMEENFGRDYWLITLLSAIAIFIVVALTFRSLLIPLMLVLIVQCGVYITVLINALMGQSIYYMSLLVVQCILMGATIDYGIVFTNYYLDNRKFYDVKDSLIHAFEDSIHTILTSSMVIVFITGIIGFCPADPAITKICLTIAIGTLCVALLIVFVLPGLLACTDKFITKPKKGRKDRNIHENNPELATVSITDNENTGNENSGSENIENIIEDNQEDKSGTKEDNSETKEDKKD